MNTSDLVNMGNTTKSHISVSIGGKTPRVPRKVANHDIGTEESSGDLKEFEFINNDTSDGLMKSRMTVNEENPANITTVE